jgi:hypothetical protein
MHWRNKIQQYLLILAALLFPAISWASVAVTSAYNGAGTSGATATVSNVACTGSDTLLIVAAGSNAEDGPTGIVKGATALTKLTDLGTGDVAYGSIWYLKAASSTSETVVATWGTSPASGAAASAICLSGVEQTSTFGTPATGANTSTAISGQSVSGSVANDLIVDIVSISTGGGITISADAGTTERTNINPLGGWSLTIGTHASGTSQSPTWTASASTFWRHIVVNVQGTGGGGGVAGTFGLRLRILQ